MAGLRRRSEGYDSEVGGMTTTRMCKDCADSTRCVCREEIRILGLYMVPYPLLGVLCTERGHRSDLKTVKVEDRKKRSCAARMREDWKSLTQHDFLRQLVAKTSFTRQ